MQDRFVQAIRYKLQKRVRRLSSADYQQFPFLLRSFFQYVDNSPILAGVRDELLVRTAKYNAPAAVERILARQTEAEPGRRHRGEGLRE